MYIEARFVACMLLFKDRKSTLEAIGKTMETKLK